MRIQNSSLVLLTVFFAFQAQAAQKSFRIFDSKQITSQVDRFYGQDGSAFATVFCNPEAAQVMMVDSRIPELDGKTFFFGSLQNCEEARKKARKANSECVVGLTIDVTSQAARVDVGACK